MKKYNVLVLIVSLFAGMLSYAYAQAPYADTKTIQLTEAGTLDEFLTLEDIARVKSITVTGPINSKDIMLLKRMSTSGALKQISLSGATWAKEEAIVGDPVLDNPDEYFLPNIDILGKEWEKTGGEQWELDHGHTKDGSSMPGFWIFKTGMKLFFMTGYMNGWEGTIEEAVLKSTSEEYIRSAQVKQWIESMGYVYKQSRDDGDDIYHNESTGIWVLMHYTPYNTSDFPGIHFSKESYIY